ncbi:MAG: endo-1,4-beta-xylanase [Terriglobales bacterium]
MSPKTSGLRCAAAILVLASMVACGGGSNTTVNTPIPTQTLRQAAAARGINVGAAADSQFLSDSGYAMILGSEYSQLQAENEMKFGIIHPGVSTYDFTGGDALVAFAQAHTMVARGHTLVWHNQIPTWVTSGGYSAAQLSTILQSHITTVMQHYAAKVYGWDVVNEAFNDDGTIRDTIWYDQPGIGFAGLGTKYIEQALNWAHAADPNAKLYYNDYNAEPLDAKSDAIYAMAQDFKTRGVPLDGIGFQLHIDLTFDNPATLASVTSNFQRFAALGLELHITELDIRLQDSSSTSLAAQAKLYGEIAAICLQQPSCKVFQTWGFTDKYSWIPGSFPGWGWALPFDANYQKKPAYTSILNAL